MIDIYVSVVRYCYIDIAVEYDKDKNIYVGSRAFIVRRACDGCNPIKIPSRERNKCKAYRPDNSTIYTGTVVKIGGSYKELIVEKEKNNYIIAESIISHNHGYGILLVKQEEELPFNSNINMICNKAFPACHDAKENINEILRAKYCN